MGVTAAQIRAALSSVGGLGGQGWSLDTLAKGANDAMAQAGINTREGAAVFMSQCMVESAYFRTTREYGGSKARYAPYYGRGFIQVTWRDNYAKFGKWCKDRGLVSDANYFVNSPDRLADDRWAWLGAVWYLSTNGCIPRANRGENKAVGRIIHAGPGRKNYPINAQERNRQDHTMKAYNAMLRAGITAPSGGAAASTQTFTKDDVKRLQGQVGVTRDGLWGPGTDRNAQAIRAFLRGGLTPTDAQRKIYMDVRAERPAGKRTTAEFRKGIQWALGVTADGIWGKKTDAAFEGMREQHKMSSVKGDLPAPKSASKPATKKKPKPSTSKAPKFPLPKGHYFGPKSGPASSVSGYYSHKADLKKWQVQMRKRGWSITADGLYGPATKKVVRQFQKEKGIGVDGLIGAKTWAAAWTEKVT